MTLNCKDCNAPLYITHTIDEDPIVGDIGLYIASCPVNPLHVNTIEAQELIRHMNLSVQNRCPSCGGVVSYGDSLTLCKACCYLPVSEKRIRSIFLLSFNECLPNGFFEDEMAYFPSTQMAAACLLPSDSQMALYLLELWDKWTIEDVMFVFECQLVFDSTPFTIIAVSDPAAVEQIDHVLRNTPYHALSAFEVYRAVETSTDGTL